MKSLTALFALLAFTADALVVDTSSAITRKANVTSASSTLFALRTEKNTIVEVTGSGSATLMVSTDYASNPTDFTNFTPDSKGAVTGNAAWMFPAGLSFTGLNVTSGTWVIKVAQPR